MPSQVLSERPLRAGDIGLSHASEFHRQPNDHDRKDHQQAREERVSHPDFGDVVGLFERGMLPKHKRVIAHAGTLWSQGPA